MAPEASVEPRHLDEAFLRINGQLQYLWRAIDQDGDVIDILVQPRRDRRAAERFFRRLLRGQGQEPLRIITDRLRSYSAAMRTSFFHVAHTTERYANNRVEASHQPTRQRERQMRRFKSVPQAQRFLSLHGAVHNLFRLGRNLTRVENYRFPAIPILFDLANRDPGLRSAGSHRLLRHKLFLVRSS